MKKIKIFLALVGATLLSANALAETGAPSLVNYDVNGDGTTAEGEQAYELKSADDLYWFANYANQGGDNATANAVLTSDIVVNKNVLNNDGNLNQGTFREWTLIGYYNNDDDKVDYAGTFDGNGYTISGLYFNDSSRKNVGLFGRITTEATIKNVGVIDSYFRGKESVGGVCGRNSGTIANCYNAGEVSGCDGSSEIGGLCGFNFGGAITNCYNIGKVSGDDSCIGGLCGYNNGGRITKCYNVGEISDGYHYAGGVCGYNNGTIENCYNTGEVNDGNSVGGVCGYNGDGTIKNCYNTGEVNANQGVGGVCGNNGEGTIKNCYYLNSSGSEGIGRGDGEATAKTATQFASGEVAYKLGDEFYQKIDEDTLPVLNSTHGKVYLASPCIAYSNTENATVEHKFDVNGFCTACGGYEPAGKDADGVYQIANAGNLYWFADFVNYKSSGSYVNLCAKLTQDIVVNELEFDTDGNIITEGKKYRVWLPIGGYYGASKYFKGIFDGNNHTISGLYVNGDSQYIGLFGYTAGQQSNLNELPVIKNIGVINSYFKGNDKVGGICGYSGYRTIVENCYFSGTIIGNQYVGGICGFIFNSYNQTKYCYNIGTVSGNTNVGGIQGNRGDIITNSYFLEGCCANPSDNSCVKSLEAFNSGEVAFLLGDGWGQTLSNDNGFPVLNGAKVYKIDDSTYSNVEIKYDENGIYDNGSFVSYKKPTLQDDVYQIANAGNLYWFAQYVNQGGDNIKANAILTADIVVNQLEFGNDGNIVTEGKNYRQWIPIVGKYEGNIDNCYKGAFNGDNHTISGLYHNDINTSEIGLFGRTNGNATIQNVGVVNSYFKGNEKVSCICGINYGTIKNSFCASVVNGSKSVGGICGYNVNGLIKNCYNTGNVSGNENVGGICGYNADISIEYCYNEGPVSGNKYVGGVFGMNFANNNNCYNAGNISGIGDNHQYIGGIGGFNNGTVKYCFSIGTVDGEYPATVCASSNITGVEYSYCLANQDNGEQKTASQFANGTVAILLQANQDGEIWGQKLVNGKSMPVWVSSEKNCCKVKDGKIEHADLKNGFCATCGGYQQPTQDESGVYQIANAGNLYWFAQFVNQGAENAQVNAVLTADIAVNQLEFDAEGNIITEGKNYRQWIPIGLYDDNLYSGVFDGNGHTVSGLYFNDVNSTGKIGLFGCTNKNATIKNVGVVNSYFNGKNEVGGICGYSSGTIENCYNASLIKGNANVGGICGYNNSGTIQNCYNTGSVNGNSDVAGICGLAWQGSYKNCYNIGEVSGTSNFGSLIGNGTNGLSIDNGFYLSGGSSSFGTEKSEMWFSCGEVACLLGDGWGQKIVDGKSIPVLASLEKECCKVVNGKLEHLSCENGFCTSCNCYQQPDFDEALGGYQIANAGNLYWFAQFVNQGGENAKFNAVLTADIVVDTLEFENNTLVTSGKNYRQWIPIATFKNPYSGIFDGKDKTISGLYFDASNTSYVGLFGRLANATILNVTVINSYFNGNNYVGGVCGDNKKGIIQNCHNASMVIGNELVGGVCGCNGGITDTATIKNCHNTGSVSGKMFVGGVCGRAYKMLQYCYNTGKAEGAKNVGGVCGYNDNSTVENCYNIGNVNGNEQIGGICGCNWNSSLKNCYNVGKVEGNTLSGDLCGKQNNDTVTNCYYLSDAESGNGGKTAEQFADGTVAKLLFAADTIWGQNTSTDTIPNFSGKIIFTVSVTASGNGTISGTSGEYEYNSKLAIVATPNTGYHFIEWSNGSTKIKDTILVVSDTALVATFEAHLLGNWDTTLVATCAVAGLRTRACACGEVETDTIAKLAHTVVVDTAVTATCTTAGLTEGKHCSVCDSVLVAQQIVAKIAHTVVVDSAKTATCTVAGLTEGSHCSVCDSVLVAQQIVAKIAHTVVVDSAKTATCTATGLTEGKHCSVCDSVLVAQQTIPALGHKIETIAGVSSTCTVAGLTEGSRCSVCGEVIVAQDTVSALGHSFTNYIYNNDATTEADGTETAVCDHGCGATDTRTAEGTKLTDIAGETANAVVIYAHHNIIVVENSDADIYVYDATGRCIEMRESCPSVEIALPREGIYIVRTGNKVQRLAVVQN